MSYLDYSRTNDMSTHGQLRHDITYKRTDVLREIDHARTWRSRPVNDFQCKAIANHARRARVANHELLALRRQLRALEVYA